MKRNLLKMMVSVLAILTLIYVCDISVSAFAGEIGEDTVLSGKKICGDPEQFSDGRTSGGEYGVLSDDETYFIFPDGSTLPNTLKSRIESGLSEVDGDISEPGGTRDVTTYSDYVNSSDQTGVYWSIKSKMGYYQATSYLTLPTISETSASLNDRLYMMYSVNTMPSSIIGDYGLVYYPTGAASSHAGKWCAVVSTAVWDSTTGKYNSAPVWAEELPSSYGAGSLLYLQVKITNTANTDTVTLYVKDGYSFSVVKSHSVSFSGNPINASCSNVYITRAITAAQFYSPLNSNTGTYMQNAIFTNAYLYSTVGYYQWSSSVTYSALRKAPSTSQLAAVIVNSYSVWYNDNISIRFNIP